MTPGRTLISEATLSGLADGAVLVVAEPYLITPSAAALARQRRIEIRPQAKAPDLHPQAGADDHRELAGRIESTRLDSTVTPERIDQLCREAQAYGFAGVCIAPHYVARAAAALAGSSVQVVTVAGFPLGFSQSDTKAFEAARAVGDGAREIDMVIAQGPLLAGDWRAVHEDIRTVREALDDPGLILKVIIEAPVLTPEQIVQAALLAVLGGADFVKTGTGFRGPATPEAVALIRRAIGGRARIKAAGGIRTAAQAHALIAAGADRLGTSAAAELVGPASTT